MINTAPIRYDRLRQCLQGVLNDALGPSITVKWSRDSVPRDATKGDMVVLSATAGPDSKGNWRGRFLIASPDSITFTIDTATTGETYSIYLNEFAYRYDAVGGDTVDDIRAALLALIANDERSPYAAAAGVPAGEFTVTGDFTGSLWQAEVLPVVLWTVVQGATAPTVIQKRQSVQTLTVGCFSKGVDLFDGAHLLAGKVNAAFRLQTYQTTFQNFQVSPQTRGPIVDLSAIAGSTWETRTSQDIGFGLPEVTTEPTETIDTLAMTANYTTQTGADIFTNTFTLTT